MSKNLKNIFKFSLFISFCFSFLIIPQYLIFAQSHTTPSGLTPLPDIELNIFSTLWKAVNWFFNIVIILCVIMIIYAGFTYVTSGGDTNKTKKALQTLVFALIGLAVAILGKALVNLIAYFISGGQIQNIFENSGGPSGQTTAQNNTSQSNPVPSETYTPTVGGYGAIHNRP